MLTPQQALHHYFGFDQFREGQEEVIQQIINKQNCLLVMPTGSGKSLTYQLPGTMLDGLTLVISPLIALMKDQVDSLVERGIRATFVNSSLPSSEGQARMRAVLEGDVKLLYVAPERLRNHQFTRALSNMKISLLAVDEAHCLSQWGHDFRPDYLQIGPTWQAIGRPTLLATTATATPLVQKDIAALLGLKDMQTIVTGFNRPNLTFMVKNMPNDKAKLEAVEDLLKNLNGSAILYAATRRKTEELADLIRTYLNIPTLAYHGGLERLTREQIQNDFMADRAKIIVATNAFGMGVDKANVRLVIHYNMPGTVEAYYQEAGRAGRDGQPAQCILLFAPDDQSLQEWMINSDTPNYEDLFQIYTILQQSAQDQVIYITHQELANFTNVHPVKVRVTLNELEQAGLIFHLGSQGAYNQWKILPFSQQSLENRAERIQKRTKIRLDLLNDMLQYIYLNTCRRQFMLSYFGDLTPPRSPRCCDNHHQDDLEALPKATTPQEWYPLIILETARSLSPKTGRIHLSRVLAGSQAQQIKRLKHDRYQFYGKLTHLGEKQIRALIDALIDGRYLHLPLIEGVKRKYAVVDITPLGLEALQSRVVLPIDLNLTGSPNPNQMQAQHSHTILQTHQLFMEGLAPKEIANQRGLTEATIYRHLAKLIADKKIDLGQVISEEIETQILKAIETVGTTRLSPIKTILPRAITFEEIRCVIAGHSDKFSQDFSTDRSKKPEQRIVSLGESGDLSSVPELIEALNHENGNVRRLAALALGKLQDQKAVEPLIKLLENEVKPQVRQYAINALGKLGHIQAISILEQILNDPTEQVYNIEAAKHALSKINPSPKIEVKVVSPTQNLTQSTKQAVEDFVQDKPTASPKAIILELVEDLEGLLTPQTLCRLLIASTDEIVAFSDHELCGKLNGILSANEVETNLEELIQEGKIVTKFGLKIYLREPIE